MLYSHTTVIIACLHLLVNGSAVFVSLERKKKKCAAPLSQDGAVQHHALLSWVSIADLQRGRN